MTIEEAKQLLPIMQAYIDGKQIQTKCKTDSKALTEHWIDVTNPDLDIPGCFRVKPEPKFRPFKNADECWQEMQKHQPFGWAKTKDGAFIHLSIINPVEATVYTEFYNSCWVYDEAFDEFTFADGTPFGIKED